MKNPFNRIEIIALDMIRQNNILFESYILSSCSFTDFLANICIDYNDFSVKVKDNILLEMENNSKSGVDTPSIMDGNEFTGTFFTYKDIILFVNNMEKIYINKVESRFEDILDRIKTINKQPDVQIAINQLLVDIDKLLRNVFNLVTITQKNFNVINKKFKDVSLKNTKDTEDTIRQNNTIQMKELLTGLNLIFTLYKYLLTNLNKKNKFERIKLFISNDKYDIPTNSIQYNKIVSYIDIFKRLEQEETFRLFEILSNNKKRLDNIFFIEKIINKTEYNFEKIMEIQNENFIEVDIDTFEKNLKNGIDGITDLFTPLFNKGIILEDEVIQQYISENVMSKILLLCKVIHPKLEKAIKSIKIAIKDEQLKPTNALLTTIFSIISYCYKLKLKIIYIIKDLKLIKNKISLLKEEGSNINISVINKYKQELENNIKRKQNIDSLFENILDEFNVVIRVTIQKSSEEKNQKTIEDFKIDIDK